MPRLDATFDFLFDLIAVLSSVKPHKLAWSLNKNLHLQLQRQANIQLTFNDETTYSYINFLHKTDHVLIRLIRNKALENNKLPVSYLLPELAQYDYLLLINDQTAVYKKDFVKKVLSSIVLIEHQLVIDPINLKNKDNLMFFQE